MKILLSVLQELGGTLSDARFQQLLFLYCREFLKSDRYYEFVPWKGSPYSLQAAQDKRYLGTKKYLEESAGWALNATDRRFAVDLDFFEKIAIQDMKNTWSQRNDDELKQHIAAYHGYYTHAMKSPDSNENVLYTIGYEGFSPEAYINMLIGNSVKLLCDVRRNPFSKKYGFSKLELSQALPHVGIEYLHIPELGIVSEKRKSLETDSDYHALFAHYETTMLPHQQGKLDLLQRLLEEKKHIAITCFEADPFHCHRSIVAKALKARESFTSRIEHLPSCPKMNILLQNARKY